MAVPITAAASVTGGAFPQLSGSAVPNRLWARKLLEKFYASTVFGSIASTDYEGDVKALGDSVTIRTTPNITVSNYTKGMTLPIEAPLPGTVNLNIDQAKFFNFITDDVDKLQSDLDFVEDWTRDAAEQMKITMDTELLAYFVTGAVAANTGITAGVKSGAINLGSAVAPRVLTNANVIDYIVDHEIVLDEQNVPANGRWMVLPARACGLIQTSSIRDASLANGNRSLLENGYVGKIGKFEIFNSNLLPTTINAVVPATTDTTVIAGHKAGLTFASQLTETETLRAQSTFGTLVRGLNVYGRQVVDGNYMSAGHIRI